MYIEVNTVIEQALMVLLKFCTEIRIPSFEYLSIYLRLYHIILYCVRYAFNAYMNTPAMRSAMFFGHDDRLSPIKRQLLASV